MFEYTSNVVDKLQCGTLPFLRSGAGTDPSTIGTMASSNDRVPSVRDSNFPFET